MKTIEEIIREKIPHINITNKAMKKAQYITNRVSEFCQEPVEVNMLLCAKNKKKDNEIYTIDEIVIVHDQEVSHTRTHGQPLGFTKTLDSLGLEDLRFVGWAHTHADFENFYSDRDVRTITSLCLNTGPCISITDNFSKIVDTAATLENTVDEHTTLCEPKQRNVRYCYGLTFNMRNDIPYSVIACENEESVFLYESPLRIIEDNYVLDDHEKDSMDAQIIERVFCLRERKTQIVLEHQRLCEDANKHYIRAKNALDELCHSPYNDATAQMIENELVAAAVKEIELEKLTQTSSLHEFVCKKYVTGNVMGKNAFKETVRQSLTKIRPFAQHHSLIRAMYACWNALL